MGGDKLREEMDKVRLFFFYNVDRFNREIMQSVKIASTLIYFNKFIIIYVNFNPQSEMF